LEKILEDREKSNIEVNADSAVLECGNEQMKATDENSASDVPGEDAEGEVKSRVHIGALLDQFLAPEPRRQSPQKKSRLAVVGF
jgi:hypothetical protein